VITPSQTKSKYTAVSAYLPFVRSSVVTTLSAYCDANGYAFTSRLKSLESVSEKIESGRYQKWSQIDDLIACAIIVPTLSEETAVLEFLNIAFAQRVIKKRGSTRKSPDTFRFDSTRFIGCLLRPETISPDEPVYQVQFEIQIRSAFEHAWTVTTHALTYKGQDVSWNRIRLTAQLKAAVEQLDMLILGFEEASAKISASSWPETEAKATIVDFFRNQVEAGSLPPELSPKDWSRFVENAYGMVKASSWGNRKPPKEIAEAISKVMSIEILSLGRDRIPLSVSLLQFVFATLCNAKLLAAPLDRYCPIITPELEEFYPVTKTFSHRFDYSG
jgi:ppGpp synthetase/RelA/SpoT-type nucleotidyltranferase